jgi:hypothetical protein
VAAVPILDAPLAGDHLQHPLELIPMDEPCARVEARTRSAWVVIRHDASSGAYPARDCFAGREPAYRDATYRVYPPD